MSGPAQAAVPMVGASGSIAAAMGAFLLFFASTNVKVFWLYFAFLVPRYGTFSMPAYLVLPAWLFNELFSAWLYGGHATVGHWAHIGGFVFGLGFAAALKYSKLEEKLPAQKAVLADVVYETPAAVVEGRTLLDRGEPAQASAAVAALLTAEPDHPEALPIRLAAAAALGDGVAGTNALAAGVQ